MKQKVDTQGNAEERDGGKEGQGKKKGNVRIWGDEEGTHERKIGEGRERKESRCGNDR